MGKISKILAAGALALAMVGCSSGGNGGSEEKTSGPSYVATVTGYDWGCGTNKVIVTLPEAIDSVSVDDVTVSEHKQTTDWTAKDTPVIEADFDRKVEKAYLVDADGKETTEASDKVCLELYVSPSDGSPFLYTMATGYNTWADPYDLTIKIGDTEITEGTLETVVDDIAEDSFEASDGTVYNYAHYDVKDSDTVFVWLHGMGEGGAKDVGDATNVKVTELANKVTAFYGEEFQEALGGANILVPQAPTFWLDMTGEGVSESRLDANDGSSYYTKSLKELIDDYAEKVGASKIILAGCSNGGFMVMNMADNYPDAWTALVPICEAYKDENLKDEDIEAIKDIPMFFIYSKADTTVDPTVYEEPTLERLEKAGASNVKVFAPEDVHDNTGLYFDKNDDGEEVPHVYSGHWSWIYFDNNEAVAEDGTNCWTWLGDQVK